MHLLSAVSCVTSVAPCFCVGNGAGALVQITQLYNSRVERLKKEGDWLRMQPAFTCGLWKSMINTEYFFCATHWVWESGQGDGVEIMSGDDL